MKNNPPSPPQRRSRIVINLERAREMMHLHPHGQQPDGVAPKRKKWPIVLGIIGIIIIGLVIGGFFYWQHYKTKPAYSLALVIDAAQRNDAAAFDEVVDTDQIAQSFAPQMIDEASARFGNAMTPALRQRVEALIPTLLPKIRDTVHAEVMKQVKEATTRAQGKPFFLVALYLPYVADIEQNNDTATVSAKANDRQMELTMQRSAPQRWKIVAVKDSVLAKNLIDNVMTDLPSIGSNIGDEVRKRLPGILSGSEDKSKGKHR